MIIEYIIEILKNSDDVYINELGLFKKKRTSSEIQEGVISPPQIKVFFNENGEGNGFAFILKYAEKKQKRINDADAEIRQWVEELKNSLANNKSITFENFGTFSLNSKNEMIFESGLIKDLNVDFEGMEPIQINEGTGNEGTGNEGIGNEEIGNEGTGNEGTGNEGIGNEETGNEGTGNEGTGSEEIGSEEIGNEEIGSEEDDISDKNKKKHTWIIVTIILIVILGVGGYFAYPYLSSLIKGETTSEAALIVEKETSSSDILPEEIATFEDEFDVQDVISEETDIILQDDREPISEKEVKPITQSSGSSYSHENFVKGSFYVIAGSFITEKSATQHISQHRLQEYNPILLHQEGNNRVRVCIGIFNTEEEAQKFADQFNRNYWVLH